MWFSFKFTFEKILKRRERMVLNGSVDLLFVISKCSEFCCDMLVEQSSKEYETTLHKGHALGLAMVYPKTAGF